MNWTLLSILLVFPMSLSMGAAYSRRDKAIGSLQSFKSNVLCTFLAHLDWDWPFIPKDPAEPVVSGRGQRLSPDHVDRVFNTLKELTHLLRVLLLAPRVSQVRHFCTRLGKKQRARVLSVSAGLQRRLMLELHSLSLHVEQLKAAGLPANEAARIRQYFLNLVESVRSLLSVKRYHTPLGMRAFSRLFILLLPWLFGPYFGALATAVGIAFSISFSCTTSLALLGLFTIRYELEDPFLVVGHYGCRDSIDVGGELDDLEAEMMLYTTPRQVRHTMDQSGAS